MAKDNPNLLDFEIDKLINSIENTVSGEVFDTEIVKISLKEKRLIKKSAWLFDWHIELNNEQKEVFKLTTVNNPEIIQGLMSFEDKKDHIFCTFWKVQNLIRENGNYISGLQAI